MGEFHGKVAVIVEKSPGMGIENKSRGGLVCGWEKFHLLYMFGLGANRNILLSMMVLT